MLEILAIVWLCKRIGRIVREKGRSAGGFQFLAVVLWLGGEILGAIVGAMTGNEPAIYVFALCGAVVGAIIANIIASSLSPLHSEYGAGDDVDERYSCGGCGEAFYQADHRFCPVCGDAVRA